MMEKMRSRLGLLMLLHTIVSAMGANAADALRQAAAEEPEEAKFNTLRGGDSVHAASSVLTEMGKVAPAPSVETAEKSPSTV